MTGTSFTSLSLVNSLTEAVFLVKNERVQLDLTVWMEGEGAEEVKTWAMEKDMGQQIVKMKWLIESPEEELRRAKPDYVEF